MLGNARLQPSMRSRKMMVSGVGFEPTCPAGGGTQGRCVYQFHHPDGLGGPPRQAARDALVGVCRQRRTANSALPGSQWAKAVPFEPPW